MPGISIQSGGNINRQGRLAAGLHDAKPLPDYCVEGVIRIGAGVCAYAEQGINTKITSATSHPLFSVAATRVLEQHAQTQLAPHTLMQRAGLAVARLALALAPHAQSIWIACGASCVCACCSSTRVAATLKSGWLVAEVIFCMSV